MLSFPAFKASSGCQGRRSKQCVPSFIFRGPGGSPRGGLLPGFPNGSATFLRGSLADAADYL